MFNSVRYDNSLPDGFSVLEIVTDAGQTNSARQFVPLKSTHLSGSVSGPVADLELTQIFGYTSAECSKTLEAVYRFPLPGDAAVTGVTILFGNDTVIAVLKEREAAEIEYLDAKRQGKQAALTTRESPDVFTLSVTGIRPDEDIRVVTKFVMMNVTEGPNWTMRIPLTTAPRYVRADERRTRQSNAQPLISLRDPGHRFGLNLKVLDASDVHSSTHAIVVKHAAGETATEIRLKDGDTVPNRDFLLSWRSSADIELPVLHILLHKEGPEGSESDSLADTNTQIEQIYFLAMATAPSASKAPIVPREIILLLDRSGSMEGEKWAAADDAALRILADLNSTDVFTIGLFHTTTRWFSRCPMAATQENIKKAQRFLNHRDTGGTELGVAMEQALRMPTDSSERARHLLIITDAQVTDEGRLRSMVKREAKGPRPRRVSIICIDTAPNSHLVNELVAAGNGIAKFLTSSPSELSLSTALESLAAEFRAPLMTNVALEINRQTVDVFGHAASKHPDGSGYSVTMGDLVAGRTRWICGKVPAGDSLDLSFRLRSSTGHVLAARRHDLATALDECPGVRAFFGASRLSALEYLLAARLSLEDLPERLSELGFSDELLSGPSRGSVYPENRDELHRKSLKKLLVSESLRCGLACSETAFIAVRRTESCKDATIDAAIHVANALPEGWSHDPSLSRMPFSYSAVVNDPGFRDFALAEYSPFRCSDVTPRASAPRMLRTYSTSRYSLGSDESTLDDISEIVAQYGASENGASADVGTASQSSGGWFRRLTDRLRRRTASTTSALSSQDTIVISIYCGVPAFDQHHSVLFDTNRSLDSGTLPSEFNITGLELTIFQQDLKPESLHPALTLRIYLGESKSPAVEISLANLLRKNGSLIVSPFSPNGDRIVVQILDPCGTWETAAPIVDVRFKGRLNSI